MNFDAPDRTDLANVCALNRAFLGWLGARPLDDLAASRLPPALVGRITTLGPASSRRLAASPFLLFGLADKDERRWQAIFDDAPARDLFIDGTLPDRDEADLVCATLGFLWDLVRRRPYVARVLCGANPGWCERLADCALVDVLQRAAAAGGLLGLIRPDDATFWQRLIDAGTDEDSGVRAAARLAALQTVLTQPAAANRARLPAAACRMRAPARSKR